MGLVEVLAQHGYAVVAITLFLSAAGLPLPTSIILLAAGAGARQGLDLRLLLPIAIVSALSGDVLLFFGGRYTGWWLLAGMCRLSMNPEGCIFSSSAYFYRRGAKTLLFSKWIPGLSSMAAPLAGSLNMRFWRFLRLDVIGVTGYILMWTTIGFLFSRFLGRIEAWLRTLGHAVLILILLLVVSYLVSVVIFWIRARKYNQIEKVSAETLRERLESRDRRRSQSQLLRSRHAAHQELHSRRAHPPQGRARSPARVHGPRVRDLPVLLLPPRHHLQARRAHAEAGELQDARHRGRPEGLGPRWRRTRTRPRL
jgi:membrane protein DedA with SNARE-associated domain